MKLTPFRIKLMYYEKQEESEQRNTMKWIAKFLKLSFEHCRYVHGTEPAQDTFSFSKLDPTTAYVNEGTCHEPQLLVTRSG